MTAYEETKLELQPGKLFINGRWEEAQQGGTIGIVNPATGDPLPTVPDGQSCAVDCAVAAARASFERKSWRGMDSSRPGAPGASQRLENGLLRAIAFYNVSW